MSTSKSNLINMEERISTCASKVQGALFIVHLDCIILYHDPLLTTKTYHRHSIA